MNIHTFGEFLESSGIYLREFVYADSVCHAGEIPAATSHLGFNFLARLPIPGGGPQLMNC